MSIEQMRAKLLEKYPGSKKISNMPDKQVHAVYTRLLSRKQL
ncbi:hypothetical protein SEA_GOCRAZY_54 [Arthrobacter phage GoCrazy]|uniref:Uncharacterized protein n=1 Tax=Arthrobacter phage KeaneyLin TaxID=2250412 RepID=A0A345KME0_9CAUD|nr:hypothetical protein PQB83_gp54 [Arthrobacter phage KeaneyLin]AXH44192.1 hypothetical protein SEA_KEANEYLIN_54 [Arthrobacter phage KeaneyLin]QXO13553.1 hypothetical protein SEA_GOCRAZY_54 [Arthrobacter phage GoCrazy]UYL87318.1 hypothetical protein SEA_BENITOANTONIO_55 [Arthrobacter phage BenitoAntonio]WBF79100.1 hypothetical protein SEA_HANKLY_54 [Arthrobacter phage Hankly]